MILTCPSCSAQFMVDSAKIPPDGREVRCASCHHQWHAYPEGNTAELKPLEPEPIAEIEEEKPNLIAYPDPEPESEAEPEENSAFPEDKYKDDSDTFKDPEPQSEPDLDPHLPDDIDFTGQELEGFGSHHHEGAQKASLKPLLALAAVLLLAVIVTAFMTMRPVLQPGFGFVYAMFGAELTDGLVLSDVQLRQRPSRSKARYIVEGNIINHADEMRHVPLLRIAMIGTDGEVMVSREYEDANAPILQPGESYAFKAANLETSFVDKLEYFVVDIGSGHELMLRKPTEQLPEALPETLPETLPEAAH